MDQLEKKYEWSKIKPKPKPKKEERVAAPMAQIEKTAATVVSNREKKSQRESQVTH